MVEGNWHIVATSDVPESFMHRVELLTDGKGDRHLAQLLWQRGFTDEQELAGFLNPDAYEPTSAFAFGQEMKRAVNRLIQARERQEKVAIWGDFDADGVTATSVLWEGLGQFFCQETQLTYYIPNRFTESHGLNQTGLDQLKAWGASLIVTCDTGSTNLTEIAYAKTLGIEIIITDHHTLPKARPDVLSIINPRYFAENHPLFHLSGVAVAYKLIEALYVTLPDIPTQSITYLLDLVAIGLIADLVALKGDCRYLAQLGIRELQKQLSPQTVVHPGVKFLLEACRKTGDRPTDISFGIGPRINAISRIHGDARFCVKLLTSRDLTTCQSLAQQAELANSRRKEIQQAVMKQAQAQVATLDLSTMGVLVLGDRQWQGGVLGLVASQVAQEFGRPTILLSYDREQDLWQGSARSVQGIDLYELVASQAHLLHRFGGHPFAAGLSLKAENLELFKIGINQQARQLFDSNKQVLGKQITIDLVVMVNALGKSLFQALKCLEPCGMGNPVPKILVQNAHMERRGFNKLKDKFNRKLNYFKTNFILSDETGEIEGVWWGGHPDDLPQGSGLDVVVELDYSSFQDQGKYFVRLLATRKTTNATREMPKQTLVDFRQMPMTVNPQAYILQADCPQTWQDLYPNYQQALTATKPLALAYNQGDGIDSAAFLKQLMGMVKYLTRQQKMVTTSSLKAKLNCGDRLLHLALETLINFGYGYEWEDEQIYFFTTEPQENLVSLQQFKTALLEGQFQQDFFINAPLEVMQHTLNQFSPL